MARGGLRCSSHWPTSLSPLSMSYAPRVDGMSGETWDLGPASSGGCWKGGAVVLQRAGVLGPWGQRSEQRSCVSLHADPPRLHGVIWLALFCPSSSAQGPLCSTLGLPPGVLTVRRDTPEEGSVVRQLGAYLCVVWFPGLQNGVLSSAPTE